MKNRVRLSGFGSQYKFMRRVMDMKERGWEVVDMGVEGVPTMMDTYKYKKKQVVREGIVDRKHWAVMERVEAKN